SGGAEEAPGRLHGAVGEGRRGVLRPEESQAGPAAADRVSDTPAETPAASQAGSDTESRYSLDTGPRPTGVDAAAVRQALAALPELAGIQDRKSTRLNSSHVKISYAVFCLKKKRN